MVEGEMAEKGRRSGPLAGIKVIDCTTVVAGPLATQILADQGADVIKVEPNGGDIARALGHIYPDGFSSAFIALGRNKRSIGLDLSKSEAVELIKTLVADADVFVSNTRPGVMDRHGLGFEVLRAINPTLVYAELTGFGQIGPLSDRPAYDPIIQALSGMAAQGEDGVRLMPQLICDKVAGLSLAQAISAALVDVTRSKQAQKVHVSLLSAAMAFLACDSYAPITSGDRAVMSFDLSRVYEPWPTADGEIVLVTVADSQFEALIKALGCDDILVDERFDNLSNRVANYDVLRDRLTPLFLEQRTEWWLQILRAVDVPVTAAYNDVTHLVDDSHVAQSAAFSRAQHPHFGEHWQVRPAADFSSAVAAPDYRPAPTLGEHSREVLQEHGIAMDDIERLFKSQAVV